MSPLIKVYYFDNYKHIFGTSIIKVMYKKKLEIQQKCGILFVCFNLP